MDGPLVSPPLGPSTSRDVVSRLVPSLVCTTVPSFVGWRPLSSTSSTLPRSGPKGGPVGRTPSPDRVWPSATNVESKVSVRDSYRSGISWLLSVCPGSTLWVFVRLYRICDSTGRTLEVLIDFRSSITRTRVSIHCQILPFD